MNLVKHDFQPHAPPEGTSADGQDFYRCSHCRFWYVALTGQPLGNPWYCGVPYLGNIVHLRDGTVATVRGVNVGRQVLDFDDGREMPFDAVTFVWSEDGVGGGWFEGSGA